MAPQAFFNFPGVQRVVSAGYTLSHGVSPGIATLRIAPQSSYIPDVGTFEIVMGNTILRFHQCRVDRGQFTNSQGGQTWTLPIFDKRWRWLYGEISGHYNLKNQTGQLITETEKTPQELARLCLDAMGEPVFDVGDLPNEPRPEVHWSHANPAESLETLCEELGCRVVMETDGKVSLRRLGDGNTLPDMPSAMNADFSVDFPESPDSIKAIGGPTLYQAKFKLKAVGRDVDGKIKDLDDLSYKPQNGWEQADITDFTNIAEVNPGSIETSEKLKRAKESVFRMYRIESHVDGTNTLPGYGTLEKIDPATGNTVFDLERIIPIEETLAETYLDVLTNKRKRKPAEITGEYMSNDFGISSTSPGDFYDGDFRIDRELGIVNFSRPVLLVDNGNQVPANLVLHVAYPIEDEETGEVDRIVNERDLGGTNGTGPMIIEREDAILAVRGDYDGEQFLGSITTNNDNGEIDQELEYYIDATVLQFQNIQAGDVSYAGIHNINPDGAIQQVTWSIEQSGATTRASRNSEHSIFFPPYNEVRRRRVLREMEREARREARRRARKPKRPETDD